LFGRSVLAAAGVVDNSWTAGQRLYPGNPSYPFVWKQITANHEAVLPLSYDNWHPLEPNGPNTEFCLMLYHTFNYAWIDITCEYPANAVCEIDIA